MALVVICSYSKRPARVVMAIAFGAVALFGTVGIVRNTLDPSQELSWQEKVIWPFAELCQTTSMHARVLFTLELKPPLWGSTYVEDLPSIIPWSRFIFKESTKIPFYNEAIIDTLPWAERMNFGMSASYLAEAYANFRSLSPIFLLAVGYVLARALFLTSTPPRTITGLMSFAYAVALVCWYIRSPLSQLLPQFRFFLGLAFMHFTFQFFERKRGRKAPLLGGVATT
jgi:hypothetical protein